jgi:hypothetical protein
MTGNQEVPWAKRRSREEIKRLVREFEAISEPTTAVANFPGSVPTKAATSASSIDGRAFQGFDDQILFVLFEYVEWVHVANCRNQGNEARHPPYGGYLPVRRSCRE